MKINFWIFIVLIEHNPHYNNIVVDYLVEQPDGSYAVLDFQKLNESNILETGPLLIPQ